MVDRVCATTQGTAHRPDLDDEHEHVDGWRDLAQVTVNVLGTPWMGVFGMRTMLLLVRTA